MMKRYDPQDIMGVNVDVPAKMVESIFGKYVKVDDVDGQKLTINQIEHLKSLEDYVKELKECSKEDFESWDSCKQEFLVNFECYIMMIRNDV